VSGRLAAFAAALAMLVLASPPAPAQEECTTAVISGAVTRDGRPLLWKNRDGSSRENSVIMFRGPRYDFFGVINSGDSTQVWMGMNTAGFAIMNSESMDQDGDSADTEGYFMKQALGLCARIEDLDALLRETALAGRGTRANFGCIDAYGGAAYFEAGNYRHTRFATNDTALAHPGFLVRANFSMTGKGDEGYGAWRYQRALTLIAARAESSKVDLDYMLDGVVRDLASDELYPYKLPFEHSFAGAPRGCIQTQNTINRHRTVAAVIFQGVRPGEDPALSTMWVLLGEPAAAVALPLWPACGRIPEAFAGEKSARLNKAFTRVRSKLYHHKKWPQYLDTFRLAGGKHPWQKKRQEVEDGVLRQTAKALEQWRRKKPTGAEMGELQKRLVDRVLGEI
jgi:hypothetical protein